MKAICLQGTKYESGGGGGEEGGEEEKEWFSYPFHFKFIYIIYVLK